MTTGKVYMVSEVRKFRLDGATLERFAVEDITRATIPEDFARNPKIHVCYVLRPQGTALASG